MQNKEDSYSPNSWKHFVVFEDSNNIFYDAVNQILNRMAFNLFIAIDLVVTVAAIVFTFILRIYYS